MNTETQTQFKPSSYQLEIERVFTKEDCNILVSAVAGSGKTTTLLQLLRKVKGDALFLAFNKSIVEELQSKVGSLPRVKIKTLHSIGQSSIMSVFGRMKLNDNKTLDFCKKLHKVWEFEDKDLKTKEWWRLCYSIKTLYGLFRMTLCNNSQDLMKVCDTLGMEYDSVLIERVLQVHTVAVEYNKRPKEIDFTDMIYLPATDSRIRFSNPSVTFIDECQDLNAAQHKMIDKIIGTSRFIAVGDRAQAIYGFSGSDSESFDKFLEKQNVKELPLSVCYRCGKKIVEHANEVYDIMKPFEHSKDGEVTEGSYSDANEGDMIICRNTAPLVTVYFNLLKSGKRAYVKGKDIGQSLISLVSKEKVITSKQLRESLENRLESLAMDLVEKYEVTNPETHPRYVSLLEKIQVIDIFCSKYYTKVEVEKGIEQMFSDERSGVILCTIHKSKGLESDVVYFLDQGLLPSKYATTESQKVQEENLKYVARTRAKSSLIYCSSEG